MGITKPTLAPPTAAVKEEAGMAAVVAVEQVVVEE